MNKKALPPMPASEMGYGGGKYGGYGGSPKAGYGGANGTTNGSGSGGYSSQRERRGDSQEPSGRVILDGYRNDIMNGFELEKPRYNTMNPTRPQSSMLLNVNDPIQVHLLVETALGDSKEFEILSQEEVDELKKQIQYMSQRIEQTRQNLAIQTKYRDAAISMAKLYAPNDKKDQDGKRRSFFGHTRNPSEQVREAEQERIASERKCEDLASELFSLEKRMMEPQKRLLKHTAGILQMTHKGPKKLPKSQGGNQQPGIPGSPESMYTYSNGRSSLEPIGDELFFDDRSAYKSFADLDDFEGFGLTPKAGGKEQMQIIAKTEQKLEDLNTRLREVIIKANPERGTNYNKPPMSRKDDASGETLQSHLDYLERAINAMGESSMQQQNQQSGMEETLEELNREVRSLLLPYQSTRPEPPRVTGKGLNQQMTYFQDSMNAIELQLSTSGRTNGDNQEQMEAVMEGLWEVIMSGEEQERQMKQERRKQRSAQNLPPDEDDSPDEDGNPNEEFSLQAFSAKVQRLYSQATRLNAQKKVLQRQIKQQRELNNKSDEAKDAEMAQKVEELSRTQALLTRTENDADEVRKQLSLVMDQLDSAKQAELSRGKDASALQDAQAELRSRNNAIAALEEQLQEMQDDRAIGKADMETKLKLLTTDLAAAEAKAKNHDSEIQKREQEIEEANIEIANLRTEVTIARAELDGAYGSRAERAAERAGNPAMQKEIDELMRRNSTLASEIEQLKKSGGGGGGDVSLLKKELEETISEFEVMTKASIEWEKEREKLEANIDKLRDERESLEAQLSDEKVRWLGMKSPGVDGNGSGGAGATSTTVLKNEFKKMMRDTRAENTKALRAEQAERRKLEDEVRALKKAQGPGKSSLSQSMGA